MVIGWAEDQSKACVYFPTCVEMKTANNVQHTTEKKEGCCDGKSFYLRKKKLQKSRHHHFEHGGVPGMCRAEQLKRLWRTFQQLCRISLSPVMRTEQHSHHSTQEAHLLIFCEQNLYSDNRFIFSQMQYKYFWHYPHMSLSRSLRRSLVNLWCPSKHLITHQDTAVQRLGTTRVDVLVLHLNL